MLLIWKSGVTSTQIIRTILKYFMLTIIPPALCQYGVNMEMEPDVTFGEHNDRFDLTSLIQQQNNIYKNKDEDLRRYFRSEESNEPGYLETLRRRPIRRNLMRRRHMDNDFAYRDNMETQEGDGGVEEYETNLQAYKAKGRRYRELVNHLHGVHARRVGSEMNDSPDDLKSDILLHYAVPIEMKLQGYLQAPIEE